MFLILVVSPNIVMFTIFLCFDCNFLSFLGSMHFFVFVSILTRDIGIAILSVCLPVRHVPVLNENGLTLLS